jgi:hypothetical protein
MYLKTVEFLFKLYLKVIVWVRGREGGYIDRYTNPKSSTQKQARELPKTPKQVIKK